MRETASGSVTAPRGPVTLTSVGGFAPEATRPTTNTVSSATIAERSRGTTRSTPGPRSIDAPSHAGRSASSSKRSAARAAPFASVTRCASAPRERPESVAIAALSPTPSENTRTGRGSFASLSPRSLRPSSPTVGVPSPM